MHCLACLRRLSPAQSRSASTMNYIGELKPATGSTHKRQRVGRGDSSGRGNSAGRGQKGQKARSGGQAGLYFEGGQTPLTRAFPKRGFTPPTSHPPKSLTLRKLAQWINDGRIDASKPITLRELHTSRLVRNIPAGGVKLLSNSVHVEMPKLPPIQIMINKASRSAIQAIEQAGGSIICRYYNALGVRAVARPDAFIKKGLIIPRLADPIAKKDIEWYSRLDKRGYLALRQNQAGASEANSVTDPDTANEKGKGEFGVTEAVPKEDIPATTEDLRGGV